jgi:hypothetical protein
MNDIQLPSVCEISALRFCVVTYMTYFCVYFGLYFDILGEGKRHGIAYKTHYQCIVDGRLVG